MIILFGNRELISLLPQELQETSIEVIENITSIDEAVTSIKHALHYTYCIFDIDKFDNSTDEFLKALYGYKAATNAKVIVVAFGRQRGDAMLTGLIDMGVYDFLTSLDKHRQLEQMEACIQSRSYEDIMEFIPLKEEKPKSVFKLFGSKEKKRTIHIALAGVIARMGTTTQALRLVRYFETLGKACYVEVNNSVHVSIMAHVFSNTKDCGGHYELHNVRLYPNNSDVDTVNYDFVILDCGCNTECTEFQSADIKIIVAGSTAWEMSQLAKTMSELNDNSVKYIFVFTGKEEQADILEFMGERWTNTCFAEYVTDMFSELTPNEKDIYQKLFRERGKLK